MPCEAGVRHFAIAKCVSCHYSLTRRFPCKEISPATCLPKMNTPRPSNCALDLDSQIVFYGLTGGGIVLLGTAVAEAKSAA